jgi:hypothetical protein
VVVVTEAGDPRVRIIAAPDKICLYVRARACTCARVYVYVCVCTRWFGFMYGNASGCTCVHKREYAHAGVEPVNISSPTSTSGVDHVSSVVARGNGVARESMLWDYGTHTIQAEYKASQPEILSRREIVE